MTQSASDVLVLAKNTVFFFLFPRHFSYYFILLYLKVFLLEHCCTDLEKLNYFGSTEGELFSPSEILDEEGCQRNFVTSFTF